MYLENIGLKTKISLSDCKCYAYVFYENDEYNTYTIDEIRSLLKEKGLDSKIVKSVTTVTTTEEVVEEVE